MAMRRNPLPATPRKSHLRVVASPGSHPVGENASENRASESSTRATLVRELEDRLAAHIETLHLAEAAAGSGNGAKDVIRQSHRAHRAQILEREKRALEPHVPRLIARFAAGQEVSPERIRPEIVPVASGSDTSLLFRLATTLWSVPVSKGYGRRMRFLVVDSHNDKLMGVLALGDPVFNLRVRDEWIGWNATQRKRRLTSVMDAFVVGAVPPYASLLGGKLVASLIGSAEVSAQFDAKYGKSRGIISGERKRPHLALVTVTSALGRSSLYNRVKLPGLVNLIRLGTTTGWGHFQVPDSIFSQMRELLALEGHVYADGHGFGQGANWRIRVIREAVRRIGLDEGLLRHGIRREVFALPLASNFREYLLDERADCEIDRPKASEISAACLDRWVIPRAERRPEFVRWERGQMLDLVRDTLHM